MNWIGLNPFIKQTLPAAILALLSTITATAHAQGTAFTYQGRLNAVGAAASGIYDLRFAIYDAASDGTPQGVLLTNSATAVSNGLFTVTLDFGNQFPGADRWLEIAVRTNGFGAFTTLSPRQSLTPTPYAVTAGSVVSGGLAAGTYGNAVTLNNAANSLSGTFTGNGASVTNVNANALSGLNAGSFWQLGGNNVLPGKFIGSTNYQPVEIVSGGSRIAHFEAVSNDVNHSSIANVINGSSLNSANPGASGVTIAGGGADNYYGSGGPNQLLSPSDFSTIGGGWKNLIYRQWATIAGGDNNTAGGDYASVGGGTRNFVIGAGSSIGGGGGNTNIGFFAVIGGGSGNTIPNPGLENTIGGGLFNTSSGQSATVAGGQYNLAAGFAATVAGGEYNNSGAMDSTVAGGAHNQATSSAAAVGGGQHNIAAGSAAAIGGGFNNNAQGESAVVGGGWFNNAGTNYATVPGGQNNAATGDTSFAAGQYAYAQHAGAFVWADGSAPGVAFASTGTNQFLIRAKGGVGINTNNPNGAALNVNGAVVAAGFAGNGSNLTSLNAAQLTGGTVPVARLSGLTAGQLDAATWQQATNLNGGNAALASNVVAGISITNAFITNSIFAGAGGGLTNVNAVALNGQPASAFAPVASPVFTGTVTAPALVAGNAQITGLIRSGTETGTSDAPNPAGLVVRRINSYSVTAGQVIARTDNLTLERDGSNGGFLLRYPALVGSVTIAAMGMDSTGAQKNFYQAANIGGTTGTIQIYSDTQNIVHFECTFGNTYSSGTHLTQVTLSRFGTDYFWSGNVISTFNQ